MTAAVCAAGSLTGMARVPKSPFKISVINDEISQDFDHVCYVISHDFGLAGSSSAPCGIKTPWT